MADTRILISTSLDVIDRYRELVEASLDGDSIYTRAKETLSQYTQKLEKEISGE